MPNPKDTLQEVIAVFNTSGNSTGSSKQIHLPKVYYPHVYLQKSSSVVTLYSRKKIEKQATAMQRNVVERLV